MFSSSTDSSTGSILPRDSSRTTFFSAYYFYFYLFYSSSSIWWVSWGSLLSLFKIYGLSPGSLSKSSRASSKSKVPLRFSISKGLILLFPLILTSARESLIAFNWFLLGVSGESPFINTQGDSSSINWPRAVVSMRGFRFDLRMERLSTFYFCKSSNYYPASSPPQSFVSVYFSYTTRMIVLYTKQTARRMRTPRGAYYLMAPVIVFMR